MNDEQLYNDEIPENLRKLLDAMKVHEEFLVPENYFIEQESLLVSMGMVESTENDFAIPEGYFEDAELRTLAALEPGSEVENFFEDQQTQIISQLRIPAEKEIPFKTPASFFERQQENIFKEIGKETKMIPIRNYRGWYYATAAACIAFVIMFFVEGKEDRYMHVAFADLLEKTELDEDDLEYFAADEDFYDLYLSDAEVAADTVINDTLSIPKVIEEQPVALDPKTGLPLKNNKIGIKPPTEKNAPTWDEVTEQEILDYLLDQGDEDLLDDWN